MITLVEHDTSVPSRLRFVAVLWRWLVEPQAYPLMILERGHPWDDDKYRTLFQLYYQPAGTEEPRHLGPVKVLQRDAKETKLPELEFDGLDERFCSLGQSTDYYRQILALGTETADAILRALRDIVLQPNLRDAFADNPGLEISLLRSVEARTALHEAGALLAGQSEVPVPPRFDYVCLLEKQGFTEPHRISFEFFPQDRQLGRVFCLVGKNATGKSTLLTSLARALSGLALNDEAGTVTPAPLLSRIIAIAYSAFDTYIYYEGGRPRGVAYHYCGLRDERGRLDIDKAFKRTESRLKKLEPKQLWEVLQRSGILATETHLTEPLRAGDVSRFVEEMKSLSSGHKLILFVLSNLMATIRRGAMILFDEPELHLHPNLLASLMRLLHAVLEEFDSYAILATHSPQIVQEIPARSVRIIERDGTMPLVRQYPRESFGANLSEITNLAFGVDEQDRNYQRLLQESASQLGPEWLRHRVDEVFRQPLGLAPYALLRRIRQSGQDDEEA